ncbi:alanine--tRNA ligase [Clostridium sp. CAG:710]|nr:alanine--tRNA ligase [Clostridium sp. CAG:710]
MEKLTSNEIRNKWISFFESKGHKVMESAPLVPQGDDSLLFINAGVTPLKKYFDGTVVPDNKRIVTIQKCIRTNDIDNVGVTKSHQTFFEMMGNFSIGDYFKSEALEFAYEFLTSPEWMGIDKDKIYVTVYTKDDEAYNKWAELGLDKSHIIRLDGNFWEIGEGPCGPDSEIFYDRGVEYDKEGDAFLKFSRDEDQSRYIEIWNNVFSQFNSKNGVDRDDYQELPHKNIDTGAGLERWCCIFQGVDSTFETDLFTPIIEKIAQLAGKEYNQEMPYKVIADHIRAVVMALSDGAIFENTGRGYVLRRLLRRSVRMGKKLGINDSFLYKLVDVVVDTMKDSYKELVDTKAVVKTQILQEEELFHNTLEAGERKLYQLISTSTDKTISGYDVFKLYDTYGFPFELTLEYLEEEGFTTDKDEFMRYMNEARQLAKNSHKKDNSMSIQNEVLLSFKTPSEFLYDVYEMESKVIGLIKDGQLVDKLDSDGYIILDKTCFYATGGGQVCDTGAIKNANFKAKIIDVVKAPNGQNLHKAQIVEGSVSLNDICTIKIMEDKRLDTAANHSSVHILQKTLQEVLSSNIHQAGSYVDNERLRFDFTYTGKIYEEQAVEIEKAVNEKISQNIDTVIREMPLEEAKKLGAMALFNEKYKDIVRVVQIGDSIELCGGTHVKNTSEIEKFAIIKLESKGSNLYRIEATTKHNVEQLVGEVVKSYTEEIRKYLSKAKSILDEAQSLGIDLEFNVVLDQEGTSSYKDIIYSKNELGYVQNEVRLLEKKLKDEKVKLESNNIDEYLNKVEEINGVKAVLLRTSGKETNVLKSLADALINMLGRSLVFIANVNDGNVMFICRSSCDIHAGLTVKRASQLSDGNGGGSPTFAQGGGKTVENLDKIFNLIREDIEGLK